MRISDWSSDVCSSDLTQRRVGRRIARRQDRDQPERGIFADMRPQRALRVAGVADLGGVDGGAIVDPVDRHGVAECLAGRQRSAEHTSELQSLMRTSYAVVCLKKKTTDKHSAKQ